MPAFTEIPILNSLDTTIEIASTSLGLPFNKNIEPEVVGRIHAILDDVIAWVMLTLMTMQETQAHGEPLNVEPSIKGFGVIVIHNKESSKH